MMKKTEESEFERHGRKEEQNACLYESSGPNVLYMSEVTAEKCTVAAIQDYKQ